MKSAVSAIALLLLLAAAPLLAQEPERNVQLTVWASQVDMRGENVFDDDFEAEFDDAAALGASANFFFNRWLSAELSAFAIRSDAALVLGGEAPLDLGKLELTPVTLGAQLHLGGQSRFDPYLGAGVAYVMADELFSADLEAVNLGPIELEDEVTYYANAGVGIQFTRGFGLALDARYIPYETTSRSRVTGVEQDLEFAPLILSAGLRLRF